MIYICKEGHRIKRMTDSQHKLQHTRCGYCARMVAVHPAPMEEQDENYMHKGGSKTNLQTWNAARAKMRTALASGGSRARPIPVSCVTGADRIADCAASLNFFPALRRGVEAAFQAHDLAAAVQFGPTQPTRM